MQHDWRNEQWQMRDQARKVFIHLIKGDAPLAFDILHDQPGDTDKFTQWIVKTGWGRLMMSEVRALQDELRGTFYMYLDIPVELLRQIVEIVSGGEL